MYTAQIPQMDLPDMKVPVNNLTNEMPRAKANAKQRSPSILEDILHGRNPEVGVGAEGIGEKPLDEFMTPPILLDEKGGLDIDLRDPLVVEPDGYHDLEYVTEVDLEPITMEDRKKIRLEETKNRRKKKRKNNNNKKVVFEESEEESTVREKEGVSLRDGNPEEEPELDVISPIKDQHGLPIKRIATINGRRKKVKLGRVMLNGEPRTIPLDEENRPIIEITRDGMPVAAGVLKEGEQEGEKERLRDTTTNRKDEVPASVKVKEAWKDKVAAADHVHEDEDDQVRTGIEGSGKKKKKDTEDESPAAAKSKKKTREVIEESEEEEAVSGGKKQTKAKTTKSGRPKRTVIEESEDEVVVGDGRRTSAKKTQRKTRNVAQDEYEDSEDGSGLHAGLRAGRAAQERVGADRQAGHHEDRIRDSEYDANATAGHRAGRAAQDRFRMRGGGLMDHDADLYDDVMMRPRSRRRDQAFSDLTQPQIVQPAVQPMHIPVSGQTQAPQVIPIAGAQAPMVQHMPGQAAPTIHQLPGQAQAASPVMIPGYSGGGPAIAATPGYNPNANAGFQRPSKLNDSSQDAEPAHPKKKPQFMDMLDLRKKNEQDPRESEAEEGDAEKDEKGKKKNKYKVDYSKGEKLGVTPRSEELPDVTPPVDETKKSVADSAKKGEPVDALLDPASAPADPQINDDAALIQEPTERQWHSPLVA